MRRLSSMNKRIPILWAQYSSQQHTYNRWGADKSYSYNSLPLKDIVNAKAESITFQNYFDNPCLSTKLKC